MLILRGEQGVRVNCNPVSVCLHSATFSSDFDGKVFLCGQDAEKDRQRKKNVIWFVWSVLFVWLNETNQINQMNQIN